jgi:hypothetical protein
MTTTPSAPTPEEPDKEHRPDSEGAPGAEMGVSEGEGSTFEPEEDPDGQG